MQPREFVDRYAPERIATDSEPANAGGMNFFVGVLIFLVGAGIIAAILIPQVRQAKIEAEMARAEAEAAHVEMQHTRAHFEQAMHEQETAFRFRMDDLAMRAEMLAHENAELRAKLKAMENGGADDENSVPGCLRRAEEAVAAGDFAGALRWYDKAIELDPTHAESYLGRAAVLEKLRRIEEAIANYNNALRLDPTNARAFVGRGNCMRMMGRFVEAMENYSHALAIDPTSAEALANRALMFLERGDLTRALDDANRAIELDSKSALAWHVRGYAARDLGRTADAIAAFQKAYRLIDNADFRKRLAGIIEELGGDVPADDESADE